MKRVHYAHPYLLHPQHPLAVTVVGCGGTGSQVLTQLLRIHTTLQALNHPGLRVTAFDPDTVEKPNLGRQAFAPADLGRNKAEVLIERINRGFGTGWMSAGIRFRKASLNGASPGNIVIGCVDSVLSRKAIKRAVKQRGYHSSPVSETFYWLDFGNSFHTGQAILGTTKAIEQPESRYQTIQRLPLITDMELPDESEESNEPSCSVVQAINRQDLFINSTLVQLGMNLLWNLLKHGRTQHRGVYVSLDRMITTPIPV
jgi:PRTRC genetic system ThiF family protein